MTPAIDHGIWLEIGHAHPAENKWIPNMIEDSQKEVLKDAFADLQAEVAQIRAERANILSLYNELIFSVASKFPGETRHQTAASDG